MQFGRDFVRALAQITKERGLSKEIIASSLEAALISAYKEWHSRRPAPPATPKKPQPDLRRAASAAPVSGRSAGAPPAAADPNDYGAAWAEATGASR